MPVNMIRKSTSVLLLSAVACIPAFAQDPAGAKANTDQTVEELRDTVVGVLQALVQKGLLTSEQAQAIVTDAQSKAQARAQAKADQDAKEKDAVRVTYVPQIVRDEISKQVSEQVAPQVADDVINKAKKEGWGIPGALPDWVQNFSFYGDLRFRIENDQYADENQPNTYRNYLAINNAGSVAKAGVGAFLNTTEDRLRERIRLRLGVDARITDDWIAGIRLATGNLIDPVTTNQTLGQYGNRYQFSVDQAYLRYQAPSQLNVPWMTLWFGRMPSPWVSTDLVWDADLQFEGVAGTWRTTFGNSAPAPYAFLTVGAFPLQEIELSTKDKWLYGGQLGLNLFWSDSGRAQLAAAYYYYRNIAGRRNAPGSTLFNFTAPQFLEKGNTLFDISGDPSAQLFALASDYRELDYTAIVDIPAFSHLFTITADYVKNIGYDQKKVLGLSGFTSLDQVIDPVQKLAFDRMTAGYQFELAFGSRQVGKSGSWRAAINYKYLERDAVLDAFPDEDFHLGGTGAKGYTVRGEWWFRDRTWLSLRYISADEIKHIGPAFFDGQTNSTIIPTDTPRFGVDVLLFDVNGSF